jgi:hypothetical protein
MPRQNHDFEFEDSVYIPTLGKSGFIQGIRHEPAAHQWLYQLTTTGDHWWSEAELSDACPCCLNPIHPNDDINCPNCGTPTVDA